jgi:hypothetical protein
MNKSPPPNIHDRESEIVAQRCCAMWDRAHEFGTDNEMYHSLVHYAQDSKEALIGMDLPPVRFCPWCGKPKLRVAKD